MKFNKKALIITTIICLLPILYGLCVYDKLPELVPTHWDSAGNIDGYSSKNFAVFGMPVFMAFMNAICHTACAADPKRANQSEKLMIIVQVIIPVLSLVLVPMSLLAAQGVEVNVGLIVTVIMGVLFIAVGNYLPKCKQNYTMGIKLPWTYNSEENWNRTHRLGGFLWVIGGVLTLVSGIFNFYMMFLPIIIVMVVVPILYSYNLYRKGI